MKHGKILDGPGFNWEKASDAQNAVVGSDGKVNWRAAFAADLEGSDNYGHRYTARYFTRVTDTIDAARAVEREIEAAYYDEANDLAAANTEGEADDGA